MQTYTKKNIDPFDPKDGQICIEDIAHALSNVCRFAGHTTEFYSVAQHSVLVSKLIEPRYSIYGLLHDATEAYFSDIPTPIKYLPEMTFFREAEKKFEQKIFEVFGLREWPIDSIKKADKEALKLEAEELGFSSLGRLIRYPRSRVRPVSPKKAEQMFLDKWKNIQKENCNV